MGVSNFLKRRHAFWARRSPRVRYVLKLLLVLVLVGVVVRSLPHLAPIGAVEIAQDDRAIEFSDRNGLPLGTLLTRDQNHTAVVALDEMSPQFIHAILAAEDQRFYHHGALDGRAIIRASLEAIQAREIVSGASTITMQLARMLEPNPRTAWNKVQEIWLSWRLAAGMSRDEILAAYINRLPMGGNVYGVEAASQVYFVTSAAHLTLAQASLLAALPNDPTDLNPYSQWLSLKDRQRYILDRMVDDGYISQIQAERALQEAIALQPHSQGIIAAPHFLFWLADQLSNAPAPQIRTTIDRPLQQFVEAQVRQVVRSLAPHRARHAAALVLDNQSGGVLAYVGSPDYFADNESGSNDGVQALRQPGSTLKPFLYQLALEQRIIQPNTILADVPTYYPIPGARLYQPTDYSETFQGPVRVRVAIANSLNVPAVRVLEKVGVQSFLDRLHQLGFEHLDQPADYYGLGLSLGSGEVTLWELAQAYMTMAQQGSPVPLRCQPSGAWCEGSGDRESDVASGAQSSIPSPASWLLITDMLGDRHARAQSFGVDSALALPFPAAVKTGTSSDFRDTWTVGFTTDYTVATWVGNFDGSPMQHVSGVMGAAPLWNRITLHLHEQQQPRQFAEPEGLVHRPICAPSGLKPTPACPAVVEEYLYPEDLVAYNRSNSQIDSAVEVSSSSLYTDRLQLPDNYNEWLAAQPSTGSSDQLRIVAPQEGDYFLIADPAQGEWVDSAQRLEFKLANVPTHPVEWWLNGEKLATQSSRSLFWSPRPGQWTLEIKQGQRGDRIHFEVHIAEPSSPKRGFSVTPP